MLEVRDLVVGYGAIRALNGITMRVGSGEVVTLIGANGAGKSTTLLAISGLLPVTSGEVAFEGERLNGLAPDLIVHRGIIHVPEGRRIFPRMSVRENLQMGAFGRNDAEGIASDIERVFALFPVLAERRNQPGGTLSGGEQQMLVIGRGILGRPRLLLLDEPSLGLAPLMVERIFDTVQRIHSEGTPILLVEQNARMALSVSDRAYILETGQIVLEGTGTALLDHPRVKEAYLGV